MTSKRMIQNILTDSDINGFLNDKVVVYKKAELERSKDTAGKVRFSLVVPSDIIDKINTALGCHLQHGVNVPFTWIKGDTPPHIDTDPNGQRSTTHLIYLTDTTTGSLVIDEHAFPIKRNCGFVFESGLKHETVGTSGISKLLLGPINATGLAVGESPQLLSLTTLPSNVLTDPFNPTQNSYTGTVPYGTNKIRVIGSTNLMYYINVTINVENVNCISSNIFNVNCPLNVGTNTITISTYAVFDGICTDPLNLTYTLTITRQAAPPPALPFYMGNMGSLFTDNAMVYYKSHSLSSGGGGSGVRNSHAKQKRT